MKRILYLSFYFEPDLCAGSFRNTPLAKELSNVVYGLAEIDLITTIPNRYKSFQIESPERQQLNNLSITRVKMPLHKSGFIDQINSFRHFYFQVKKITSGKRYDLVFASSSRLFTAYLGYVLAKQMKIPLYLDIRDIFSDTLSDVISNKLVKRILLPALIAIEKRVFNYARHINLISPGFKSYFSKYDKPTYSYYTNGIDNQFLDIGDYPVSVKISPKIITYAGNIGEGQGLHKIIPQAALALGKDYFFRIIGDGGAKEILEEEIRSLKLTNVSIEKPVKRTELIEIYKQSHFLFIHLNDYEAFKKVLPSKIFELAAFPRPIIAGVNGYAREFLKNNVSEVILFGPANVEEFVNEIHEYEYVIPRRADFINKFGRDSINHEMAESISRYL